MGERRLTEEEKITRQNLEMIVTHVRESLELALKEGREFTCETRREEILLPPAPGDCYDRYEKGDLHIKIHVKHE